MKLAVVGSGQIVADFLPHAKAVEGLELAAIFGRPAGIERLRELQAEFDIGVIHTDYDECLADPDVDTVWIALPNLLHMGFARKALRAGKHVICEKPFVLEEDELVELRTLATEQGLILVEAITTQYLTNYQWIRDNIHRLGDVRVIQCDYSQYSSRFDAFREGTVHPAFDPSKGGGALMDIGIYTLHFVIGLLGSPWSVRYSANITRGVDTSGVAVLQYDTTTAVCICAKDSGGPIRTIIQGTDGTIVVEGSPNIVASVELRLRGLPMEVIDMSRHPHRMVDEFRAFESMIRNFDFAERDRRLDHSQAVLSAAVQALASAGIALGADAR